ncbi:BCCT family transporter [Saxibacter everestensis]|uniref:BCCT family transporter n=1 Tax=Saxibacter everestensis TaxID=2909229 RepID=A0ABY8QQU4_9MICO|nr:BCCT family transporter [Brevibacteriaceae bacterium ZFBP1038]
MSSKKPNTQSKLAKAALAARTKGDIKQAAASTKGTLDWVVFGVTGVIAIAFVIWGFMSTGSLSASSGGAQSWVIKNGGWFFVAAASLFVIFVIWLAASKYGKIPLGADTEKPEFKTVSWIAMMFSAGMGIGLMFFGVAEPLSHYASPPPGTTEAQTDAALQTAMATTMFHWGLHPWAIYAVVGIAIAYGTFRKGRPQLISAAFFPLLGKKSEGAIGRVIDILAIFATLFGSAASLGLGALQIAGGIQFNGWAGEVGTPILVIIIAILTMAFVASAVSGVAKGIQWLSNINMVLALVLAVFVFVVGPTLLILNLLPTALGDYFDQMMEMASRTGASGGSEMDAWLSSWTVFYWAWWISWTPFVGMFIARISRGRTIRQFVTGVLLVPTLVSLVWFAVFGGAAIDTQRKFGDLVPEGGVDSNTALFQMLDHFPLAGVTTVLVMLLVAIFFVSGADAASIVMGSLSERGNIEPRRATVVFWGVLMGAVAAIMLIVGGGGGDALNGLQALTTVVSLPFVVVMVLLCVALYKELSKDPIVLREQMGSDLVEEAVVAGVTAHGEDFGLVTRSSSGVRLTPSEREAPGPDGSWEPDSDGRGEWSSHRGEEVPEEKH